MLLAFLSLWAAKGVPGSARRIEWRSRRPVLAGALMSVLAPTGSGLGEILKPHFEAYLASL